MEYNQENIKKIKALFPHNFIRDLTQELSQELGEYVPYATVYDCLNVYRIGGKKKQTGKKTYFDKQACFDKAVDKLKKLNILN